MDHVLVQLYAVIPPPPSHLGPNCDWFWPRASTLPLKFGSQSNQALVRVITACMCIRIPGYTMAGTRLYVLNLVLYIQLYTVSYSVVQLYSCNTGEGHYEGDLVTRITVTSSIFKFSTRFFAQIVENRETQLSSQFLGPGDNFSKSYDENQIWSEWVRARPRAWDLMHDRGD
jgi:hypothetical protein